MRKVILSMQMTLDGFVCGPHDELDWLKGGNDEWNEMFNDMGSVDTCLVGRKMYPGYADYWRSVLINLNADKNELRYAQYADGTSHIVFSKSGSVKSDWANTRLAKDPEHEIAQLKALPGKNIMVWGGAGFAMSLVNLGLIDEYRITLNPTLLGAGKSPFHGMGLQRKLQLTDSTRLKSGNVILRYAGFK